MSTPWGTLAIGVRISKYPEAKFFLSWSKLLTGGLRSTDTVLLPALHMPAHWASNALVRQFMQTDKDTLLLLDDDQTFEAEDLHRLRENSDNQHLDICGALYTHRVWPPQPLLMVEAPQPTGHKARRGEFFQTLREWPQGAVVPVQALGLGFTMIRRRVLEAMMEPDVPLEYQFWFSYGPGYESDDIPFCRNARNMGFAIGVDTSVEIGHVAALPLSAENWRAAMADGQKAKSVTLEFDGDDILPFLEPYVCNSTLSGEPVIQPTMPTPSITDELRIKAQRIYEAIRGAA